jgi:hypothetical protein
MEDVSVEAEVPFRVAKEGVKPTEGRVPPPIGPSKTAVLEVYFIKLTSLQRGPEAVDTAPINIAIVLVTSASNLVEITQG